MAIYKVERNYMTGWADAHWHVNDRPARYSSVMEAERAIESHVRMAGGSEDLTDFRVTIDPDAEETNMPDTTATVPAYTIINEASSGYRIPVYETGPAIILRSVKDQTLGTEDLRNIGNLATDLGWVVRTNAGFDTLSAEWRDVGKAIGQSNTENRVREAFIKEAKNQGQDTDFINNYLAAMGLPLYNQKFLVTVEYPGAGWMRDYSFTVEVEDDDVHTEIDAVDYVREGLTATVTVRIRHDESLEEIEAYDDETDWVFDNVTIHAEEV